jgi:hypothetical protein
VARQSEHDDVADMIESWSYRACPLLSMPYDVLLHIMAFLQPYDLCVVAQACSVRLQSPSAHVSAA